MKAKAKGFVMVIIFFVVLLTATSSLFAASVSNRQRNQMKIDQIQAQYYAESLIDTVQYLIIEQLDNKQSLQVSYEIGSSDSGEEVILPLDSDSVYTGDLEIDFENTITEAIIMIKQGELANRYVASLTGNIQILDKDFESLKLHSMDKNGDMLNPSTLIGGELSPIDYYVEVDYLGGKIGSRFRFSGIAFHLIQNDVAADEMAGELIYGLSTENMQITTTYFNVSGR